MNKIKILAPHEAQKIAAGEVVERPVSVCKELLENALDAGATQITLHIKKAGKELIEVIDNGCGMSPDDARFCFLPHATSKITKIEDLDSVVSFGFRGEALAVIAAVARVTLTTRTPGAEMATKLCLVDGMVTQEQLVAALQGTTIAIKDLFYKVPARQKFLKQDETEWNQIQNFFQAISLSHSNVHFKLYKDDALIYNLPGTANLKDRICQLFEYNFAQNILPISAHHKGMGLTISGFISNHQIWKYHRQQQFFFVNSRAVKNSELGKAVTKGYFNVLPEGRFPAVFVFITVDNALVDVNVHPRKEEVKFTKPLVVAGVLQDAIKVALQQHSAGAGLVHKQVEQDEPLVSFDKLPTSGYVLDESLMSFDKLRMSGDFSLLYPIKSARPELVEGYEQQLQKTDDYTFPARPELVEGYERQPQKTYNHVSSARHAYPSEPWRSPKLVEGHEPLPQEVLHHQEPLIQTQTTYKIIGQLLNTYLLVQTEEGLTMVDQHAMHERVLYHTFSTNFESKEGTRLMFPLVLTFTALECAALQKAFDFLAQQGIEVELFGEQQLRVIAAPPKIQHCNLKELLTELVQFIQEAEEFDAQGSFTDVFRKKLNEHLHGQMSCKAAIKAGDALTLIQMEQLMADAYKTPLNFICVHGRPTMWRLTVHEIEKFFQRK